MFTNSCFHKFSNFSFKPHRQIYRDKIESGEKNLEYFCDHAAKIKNETPEMIDDLKMNFGKGIEKTDEITNLIQEAENFLKPDKFKEFCQTVNKTYGFEEYLKNPIKAELHKVFTERRQRYESKAIIKEIEQMDDKLANILAHKDNDTDTGIKLLDELGKQIEKVEKYPNAYMFLENLKTIVFRKLGLDEKTKKSVTTLSAYLSGTLARGIYNRPEKTTATDQKLDQQKQAEKDETKTEDKEKGSLDSSSAAADSSLGMTEEKATQAGKPTDSSSDSTTALPQTGELTQTPEPQPGEETSIPAPETYATTQTAILESGQIDRTDNIPTPVEKKDVPKIDTLKIEKLRDLRTYLDFSGEQVNLNEYVEKKLQHLNTELNELIGTFRERLPGYKLQRHPDSEEDRRIQNEFLELLKYAIHTQGNLPGQNLDQDQYPWQAFRQQLNELAQRRNITNEALAKELNELYERAELIAQEKDIHLEQLLHLIEYRLTGGGFEPLRPQDEPRMIDPAENPTKGYFEPQVNRPWVASIELYQREKETDLKTYRDVRDVIRTGTKQQTHWNDLLRTEQQDFNQKLRAMLENLADVRKRFKQNSNHTDDEQVQWYKLIQQAGLHNRLNRAYKALRFTERKQALQKPSRIGAHTETFQAHPKTLDLYLVDVEQKVTRIARQLAQERVDFELSREGFFNPNRQTQNRLRSMWERFIKRNSAQLFLNNYEQNYQRIIKARLSGQALNGDDQTFLQAYPDSQNLVEELLRPATDTQAGGELHQVIRRFNVSDQEQKSTLLDKEKETIKDAAEVDSQAVENLMKQYISDTTIDDATFRTQLNQILERSRNSISTNQNAFAENIVEQAKQLKHQNSLNAIDLDNLHFRLRLARATNLHATTDISNADRNSWATKAVQWLQTGSVRGPAVTPTTFGCLTFLAANWATTSAARQGLTLGTTLLLATTTTSIIPIAAGLIAAGGLSAMRKRTEVIRSKKQRELREASGHERGRNVPDQQNQPLWQKLLGIDPNYERKIAQTTINKASTNKMISDIQIINKKAESGNLNQSEIDNLINLIAETRIRQELGVKLQRDFFAYESQEHIEKQRTDLLLAVAQARRALENQGIADANTRIDTVHNTARANLINHMNQQDQSFNRLKRREAGASFLRAATLGGAFSAAVRGLLGWTLEQFDIGKHQPHDLSKMTEKTFGNGRYKYPQDLDPSKAGWVDSNNNLNIALLQSEGYTVTPPQIFNNTNECLPQSEGTFNFDRRVKNILASDFPKTNAVGELDLTAIEKHPNWDVINPKVTQDFSIIPDDQYENVTIRGADIRIPPGFKENDDILQQAINRNGNLNQEFLEKNNWNVTPETSGTNVEGWKVDPELENSLEKVFSPEAYQEFLRNIEDPNGKRTLWEAAGEALKQNNEYSEAKQNRIKNLIMDFIQKAQEKNTSEIESIAKQNGFTEAKTGKIIQSMIQNFKKPGGLSGFERWQGFTDFNKLDNPMKNEVLMHFIHNSGGKNGINNLRELIFDKIFTEHKKTVWKLIPPAVTENGRIIGEVAGQIIPPTESAIGYGPPASGESTKTLGHNQPQQNQNQPQNNKPNQPNQPKENT